MSELYLKKGACVFIQFVIMLELHSYGFITVQPSQLYISGVTHVESTKEVCCTNA